VTPVSVRQRFNSSRRQAKKRKRRGFLAPPAIAATPSLGLLDAWNNSESRASDQLMDDSERLENI